MIVIVWRVTWDLTESTQQFLDRPIDQPTKWESSWLIQWMVNKLLETPLSPDTMFQAFSFNLDHEWLRAVFQIDRFRERIFWNGSYGVRYYPIRTRWCLPSHSSMDGCSIDRSAPLVLLFIYGYLNFKCPWSGLREGGGKERRKFGIIQASLRYIRIECDASSLIKYCADRCAKMMIGPSSDNKHWQIWIWQIDKSCYIHTREWWISSLPSNHT